MTVDEKIQQSERWLTKLHNTYPNQIEVQDVMSAFLSATNSITDHLLEDYNNKYGVGISITNKLYVQKFEDNAQRDGNYRASEFIEWYKQKVNAIKSDSIGSIMTNKRHRDIHRLIQRPDKIAITMTEVMHSHVDVFVTKFRDNMTEEERLAAIEETEREKHEADKKRNQQVRPDESSSSMDLYFQDLPDINVKDACRKFLDLMKDMVTEAHQRFP